MNKERRNPLIDYARYVFAFLVVCIHVPLAHGGTLYMPLARCAVPFFYLVTGYFLSISMEEGNAEGKMRKVCVKWLKLYGKYIALFFLISVVLDVCFHQMEHWTSTDSLWMVLSGNPPFIDQHVWNGHIYGISTLWFLYCGFLALCALYLLQKYLYTKWLLGVIITLQIVSAIALHEQWTRWLLFYSSVPFLYYGMWLGKIAKENASVLHSFKQYVTFAVFSLLLFCASVLEIILFKDVFIANIPLSLSLFILLADSGCYCKHLYSNILPPPISHIFTLDVYIWHRLIYYLMKIIGIEMYGWDAVIVFIVTLALAMTIRFGTSRIKVLVKSSQE